MLGSLALEKSANFSEDEACVKMLKLIDQARRLLTLDLKGQNEFETTRQVKFVIELPKQEEGIKGYIKCFKRITGEELHIKQSNLTKVIKNMY